MKDSGPTADFLGAPSGTRHTMVLPAVTIQSVKVYKYYSYKKYFKMYKINICDNL